jgi:hypothetical protein
VPTAEAVNGAGCDEDRRPREGAHPAVVELDRLAIVDRSGFVGIVTTGEILKLESILDTAEDEGFATSAP